MIITWIIVFLLLSAIFSGSEIAFISASKLQVELKKDTRRGKILAQFFDKPNDFLSTMLVGNNIALVVFTTLASGLITPLLAPYIAGDLLQLLLNTVILTLVVLVFGEFLPKTLFRLYANTILYFLAFPLRFLKWILTPPSWLMFNTSNFFLKNVLQTSLEEAETTFTRVDLEDFIKKTRTEFEEEIDTELFEKALKLKEVRVKECMVPRPEIVHIDSEANISDLEDLFKESKLSRILISKEDVDNVIGYVHHLQLFEKPSNIKDTLLEVYYVPEVMKVQDVMNIFIKNRLNIACVVDEFGGTAGVITLEDVLEEIFGEIGDEHDEEDFVDEKISDDEFLFSGRLEIDYINEKYPLLHLPEEDYHTLSGYIVMTSEEIPEEGSEIVLENKKFILEQVSNTKIELVRIHVLTEEEIEEEINVSDT